MRHIPLIIDKNIVGLSPFMLKWYYKKILFGTSIPLSCGMYITNLCNLKCRMCNIYRFPTQSTITMEFYKKMIHELAKSGCYYFSISGGEPFLLRDIEERLYYASQNIPYVHIVSNGTLIDKKTALSLGKSGINEISISIDGDEQYHDYLRGVPGSFRKTRQAIDYIIEYAPEVKIVVNSILADNTAQLKEIVQWTAKKKIFLKFQPLNIHPVKTGQKNESLDYYSKLRIDIDKMRDFVRYIKQFNHIVNSRYFINSMVDYFSKKKRKILWDRCRYGSHHLEIDETGKLYPCLLFMNWESGFVLNRDESLIKLMKSFKYKQKVSEMRSCKLCDNSMYICYYEPRINFPISNFMVYSLKNILKR